MPVADAHGTMGQLADETLQVRPWVPPMQEPAAGGDVTNRNHHKNKNLTREAKVVEGEADGHRDPQEVPAAGAVPEETDFAEVALVSRARFVARLEAGQVPVLGVAAVSSDPAAGRWLARAKKTAASTRFIPRRSTR